MWVQNKLIPDATEWLGKRNEEVKHIYSITKKKRSQIKIPDRHQNATDMASWHTENDSLNSTAEHFWHLENKKQQKGAKSKTRETPSTCERVIVGFHSIRCSFGKQKLW